MSKTSIKLKSSTTKLFTQRKRHQSRISRLKPFDFCCSINDFDVLTKYDPPYKSSLRSVTSVPEYPTLKLQTQFVETLNTNQKKKISKAKITNYGDEHSWKDKQLSTSLHKPIAWYIDDEITLGKEVFWLERRKVHNERINREIAIGKKRTMHRMNQQTNLKCPRWYQDFSINQMEDLMSLQTLIRKDYEEMVTSRTQKVLTTIGILSTFFNVSPRTIRKLQKLARCNVADFLMEIYKILTGNYFEDEGYKKTYDCNERLLLSSIAFLTLPETIVELHRRLPSPVLPLLPKKPPPPVCFLRKKMDSPYKEELFTRPDWATYFNCMQKWKERCTLIPIPKIILPCESNNISGEKRIKIIEKEEQKDIKIPKETFVLNPQNTLDKMGLEQGKITAIEHSQNATNFLQQEKENGDIGLESTEIPELSNTKQKYDFTITGLGKKPGPVEYKICGTLKPPQSNKKSWLGEKHAHYVISGASENPPSCPIKYEITGVANVSPTDSNEKFFAVLKLSDGPKKIYPSGRQHLSKRWQEWLQDVDEEFRKVERQANKMIRSIEATTRLVFPGPTCDSCCSCRQTRKTHIKWHETKAPYLLIDTIAEDKDKNKYIVGSMAMHSPAPSPPESTVNLLEVIASEDKITTNLVINGVTDEQGLTKYYISGIKKEEIHVPSKIIEPLPPRPLRNVPPCVCAVHQIFNKGLSPTMSKDNIPWTKEDGLCFGKKYRPTESGAYSCKTYPVDKSCRRNPFMNEIAKLKRKKERAEVKIQKDQYPFDKKKMYSIADFTPCGDEHGMAVCNGPWGALHTLTPEELAEQDRLRKEILKGPPCGTKPGRAICEGPWGAKVPMPKKPRYKEVDEIIGEEEEEDEEVEEEKEEKIEEPIQVTKTIIRRDKQCYVSPESIARRKKVPKKKEGKFIPDPNYHGYDDSWNIFRTAPSIKDSKTDYEKSLKLSTAKSQPIVLESDSRYKKKEHALKRKKIIADKEHHENGIQPLQDATKHLISSAPQKKIERADILQDDVKQKISYPKKIKDTAMKKISHNINNTSPITPDALKTGKKRLSYSAKLLKQNQSKTQRKSKQIKIDTSEIQTKTNTDDKHHIKSRKKFKDTAERQRDTQNLMYDSKSQNVKNIKDTDQEGTKNMLVKKEVNTNMNIRGTTKTNKQHNGNIFKAHRKKDSQVIHEVTSNERRKINMEKLKTMMTSPDIYPVDVEPVTIPEPTVATCKPGFDYKQDADDLVDDTVESDVHLLKREPCGWRTKSEQELPTKKNLIYLTEPDYPMETVPLRPGGKPCNCRENRGKKKILLYNILGHLDKKKNGTQVPGKLSEKRKDALEEKKTQVVDGVIYYTPPPSPKRSEEYVPEYDIYTSPYDMCLTRRKDANLKLIENHIGPKISKNVKPCDCSEYIDTYGIMDKNGENNILSKSKIVDQITKTKQELLESKLPKEQWTLALKDIGLVDYFTRCRDKLPCWLTCSKFNKHGCHITRPKMKTMKPVCECKYERKILERKEERMEWKKRQQKLKSFKKQPFINVIDTSRPIEAETKLLISGVQRIPRDDEYIDDIKYCITGVAENLSMAPPQQIMGGVTMTTPCETPETSKENLVHGGPHRHWSQTNIPPGPLPRKNAAEIAEMKRRKKVLEEAMMQIYGNQQMQDESYKKYGCEETCSPKMVSYNEQQTRKMSAQTNEKTKIQKKTRAEKNTYNKNTNPLLDPSNLKVDKRHLSKESNVYNKIKNKDKDEKLETKIASTFFTSAPINIQHSITEKNDTKIKKNDLGLTALAKAELHKMAEEGFLFAKLPNCFLMPQLQDWLIYRKGLVFSDHDKKNLMRNSIVTWNMMSVPKVSRVKTPTLHMSKQKLRSLTFDRANQIKYKIKKKYALFYSQIRKVRVLYTRSMWPTMEYRKFPCISFKEAYFTYMANKEADGYVYKPWLPSELCDLFE
ncbi:hypothetical protein KM043_006391 [Ampulex compressa]|nr:hypothetical protein KM043_006391 [Ampulex compressa]